MMFALHSYFYSKPKYLLNVIRQAGLELVLSLINRVGKQRVSDQLLLEAVLPYKENIVTMAHKSLADNESEVTATASRISLAMSWWP